MVRLLDVKSRNQIIVVVTPSDGVDITDVGAATLELVGANVWAAVDGEVRGQGRPPSSARTRF